MTTEEIIVAFIVSTVGFGIYLYGKKQRRVPQYVVGWLLMLSPLVVRDPLWASVAAVATLIGMRVAIAFGL